MAEASLPPKPANDDDNRSIYRWPGPRGKGQYDNWYAIVLHPEEPFALWFRYTLVQRTDGLVDARLWAIVSDEQHPERRVVATRAFPIDQVRLDADRFGLHLGDDAFFANGLARGRLRSHLGEIAWQLRFEPSGDTYRMIASALANRLLVKTAHVMPNGDVLARGHVTVGPVRVELKDAPLTQGHTFGPKFGPRWFWGSCPRFDGDPDSSFEGVGNDRNMSFQLTLDGERIPFNTLRDLKGPALGLLGGGTRVELELGQVRFRARSRDLAIEGRFSAGDQPFHLVRYQDTDGSFLYNCHQSRGSLELDLRYADGRRRQLRCDGRVPLEFVERHPHGRSEQDFLPHFD